MSRHRERTVPGETKPYSLVVTGDPDYGDYTYESSYVDGFKDEIMTDEVTPSYHARVRDGEVFSNPVNYECTSEVGEDTGATLHIQSTTDPGYYVDSENTNQTMFHLDHFGRPAGASLNDAPLLPISNLETPTKQRCLANVDSTPYEFFEDLAEIRETIQFLKNPLASLAQIGRAYKYQKSHMNIRDIKRKAKAYADLWNTYRFAAAPLVRSMLTALEAYNDREKALRPSRRTAHARDSARTGSTETQTAYAFGMQQMHHYNKVSHRSADVHASIYYEVTNPLDDWFFRLGLRLKDIPTTAWEIIPLSFMVDRLINIRAAIAGLVNLADPNVTILAGSYTVRQDNVHTLSLYSRTWPYGQYTATISNPDFMKRTSYTWTRSTWLPSIADTIPAVTPGYLVSDVTKCLDLIALTISRFL